MSDRPTQLNEWIDALLEGTLDDDGMAELSRALDGDVEAQRQYLRCVDLHQSIRGQLSSTATHASIRMMRDHGLGPDGQPTPSRVFVFKGRWAAAAALVMGLLSFGLWMNAKVDPVEVAEPTPLEPAKPLVSVAQVAEADGAIWSGPVDGQLAAGPHRLEAGRATLQFQDGTQLVLQGPCAFELAAHKLRLQDGAALLRSGRVGDGRAGIRFVFETPNLQLRDMGTETGVSVAAGTSRVTVFRGEVMATVTARHVGLAQQLKLTRDDGVEVTPDGVVISGIVADAGIFESMRQDKPRILVANASFEYPKADGAASLAASGWQLLSHPVANANPMDLGAGVLHAGLAEGSGPKSPRPSDGAQWAYLSAKTIQSGRTAYASMHQEVGEVEHATTYRLRMTVGWPQKLPAASFTVGLYAGTRRPTNALTVWRDPVKPASGKVAEVDLSYHAPLHSAYRGQKLYLVIEAVPGNAVGVRRVLVDHVRLQAIADLP